MLKLGFWGRLIVVLNMAGVIAITGFAFARQQIDFEPIRSLLFSECRERLEYAANSVQECSQYVDEFMGPIWLDLLLILCGAVIAVLIINVIAAAIIIPIRWVLAGRKVISKAP